MLKFASRLDRDAAAHALHENALRRRDLRMAIATGGARIRALVTVALLSLGGEALAGDAAYGQYLSSECATCHQLSGKQQGIPAITGWPEASFVAALEAYRKKERPHAGMQAIAARLSDEDIAALAKYFGSLAK